ncbi:MAG: hypothetical protein IPJ34_21000 [Myxococcales bacterium]|nr:hypothetical protein [Myxococcales bacterium]
MRRIALAALVALAACSSTSDPAPPPPPVVTTVGGMSVRLEPDPLRLVITAADGRVLFDGLPPRTIDAPTEETDPPPLTGFAVRDVATKVEMSYGSFQLKDTPTTWRVATRADRVVAATDAVSFDAVNGSGLVAKVSVSTKAAGEVAIEIEPAAAPPAGSRTWTNLGARCAADERFLGFGGQARDVEHRGTVVPLFVSEPGIGKREDDLPTPIYFISGTRHASSFPAPIYLSKRGYVGALDGFGRALFGVCAEEDVLRIAQDSTASPKGRFVFRIFDGPRPAQALERATLRFGRPRVPPRLAFAPWNDAIFGTAAVQAYAKLLRDKDIPSSAIWTEDFRGGAFVGDDYKLSEEWAVDETLYPGFDKMISDLHQQGFAFFSYFNTFVEQDNNVWKEAQPKNYLVQKADGAPYTYLGVKQKQTGMVDLTDPAAKAWMAGKMKEHFARGVDGFMADYGEWLPLDSKLRDGSDPWATHDLYPQLWHEAVRAAVDADGLGPAASPKERRVAFLRSGWLGVAPLADVIWAGDQRTDLQADDGLPTVVAMGLGLGIAGISTYGSDIAGYQTALTVPATKEVFFRWTEVGAWSPVMRTHHSTSPKKNWALDRDEESTQHFRRYAILHQQLLPVWESLAKQAHDTGLPIWRHLALAHPDDAASWGVGDQYYVGPSILVAPVMVKGASARKVYLPPAPGWLPFEPGPAVASGTRDVTAPLGEIPVFVRAGTILPLLPDTVRTVLSEAKGLVRVEDVKDDRVVLVFLGADASFTEVGGLSYALTGTAKLADAAGATWNGAALAACAATPVAPCLDKKTDQVKAFVVGPGTLAFGAAKVEVKGGDAARALVLDVRGG